MDHFHKNTEETIVKLKPRAAGRPVFEFKNLTADRRREGPAGLRGIRLLVADDDEDNRELMKLMLDRTGCSVEFACDGPAVLEEIKKKKYDLVLMDLRMPVMDGFQAAQAIRKDIDKNIPIIALTGIVAKEIEEKCEKSGMNGSVQKPLDIDKLETIINRFR